MKTPRYFDFTELVRTDTWLPNAPTWKQVGNLRLLGFYLDSVREEYGHPIKVNSGFRSRAVNEKVGGVKNSAHLEGLAADIVPLNATAEECGRLLGALERAIPETVYSADIPVAIDQLIVYCHDPGKVSSGIRFFHVGVNIDGKPRRMVLWK